MTEVCESRLFDQSGALTSDFSNLGQKYAFTLKAAEILQDIPALCLRVELRLTQSLLNRAS